MSDGAARRRKGIACSVSGGCSTHGVPRLPFVTAVETQQSASSEQVYGARDYDEGREQEGHGQQPFERRVGLVTARTTGGTCRRIVCLGGVTLFDRLGIALERRRLLR